jgi:hypothetical protein
MLLTTWKATRWEVINVVGAVVDKVLYDPSISKDTAIRRAKAIMSIGTIFGEVKADESDAERRELERLVLEATSVDDRLVFKTSNKGKADKEKERKSKGWFGREVHNTSNASGTPSSSSETSAKKPPVTVL